MKKSASAAVFLLVALALGACGPSSSDPIVVVPTPTVDTSVIGTGSVTVQGYLTSQNSGAAVPGSAVTVTDASGAAVGSGTTDASGKFSLKVNPGTYNLDFAKAGYAGSRVEGFPVTAGMTTPLNVIEKVAFGSTFPTTTPVLDIKAVVGGSEVAFPNDAASALKFNASTGITIHYKATSDATLSPTNIYGDVGVENTPGSAFFGSRFIGSNDPKNTTYDQIVNITGDALRGVRGATYLNLVVYDLNYNRINKYIPVVLNDDKPVVSPVGAFASSSARAVTISQKVNFFGAGAPSTAPTENSSMWVDLAFNYQAGLQGDITGYRVFTSSDNKTFRLLKTLPASATTARDSSPSLTPGSKVYYYVEAYTSDQSIDSPVLDTTPLDSFTLTGMGPVNHSKDVSVKPTLSWTIDKQVGDYRKFFVSVMDYPSQGGYCVWGSALCGDVTEASNNVYLDDGSTPALGLSGLTYSVPFNENGKSVLPKLDAYHSYTLDVSAAAFSKDGKAMAIAQDYFSIFYQGLGACNFGGPVCEGQLSTFTTGDGSN